MDSEAALAPLRERYALELAARHPWIAAARIAGQAQRLAQIELGSRWLDRQGGVVRDRERDRTPVQRERVRVRPGTANKPRSAPPAARAEAFCVRRIGDPAVA